MTKNLKFFFAGLFLSLPFWLAANILQKNFEDALFLNKIAKNPQVFAGQIIAGEDLGQFRPKRIYEAEDLEINARSAISVFFDGQGKQKIIFEKNPQERLPIASLTKLMTANVVLENYELVQIIDISREPVQEGANVGDFKIGKMMSVENLLYPLLMESNNDAALALTRPMGKEAFVALMNLEAKELGMLDTFFDNPSGLDPENPPELINYSTATDLVKLARHLLETKPLVWEISNLPEFEFFLIDGLYRQKLKNTNELLSEIPGIIGGKTGDTPRAGGCLLLVLQGPRNRGVLINVLLGSSDRFGEMRKLIDWTRKAYLW